MTLTPVWKAQSALTRARAVSVFRQCVISLFMVKDQHPQQVKGAVTEILPAWIEACQAVLSVDPQEDVARKDNWDGLELRLQVFKVRIPLFRGFRRLN
jgi:importin-9